MKIILIDQRSYTCIQRKKKQRTSIEMSLFVSVMAQAWKLKDPSICDLPKVRGPCRGAFPRFFYSKESGECENFLYGGCSGNENNFKFKEECERQCK